MFHRFSLGFYIEINMASNLFSFYFSCSTQLMLHIPSIYCGWFDTMYIMTSRDFIFYFFSFRVDVYCKPIDVIIQLKMIKCEKVNEKKRTLANHSQTDCVVMYEWLLKLNKLNDYNFIGDLIGRYLFQKDILWSFSNFWHIDKIINFFFLSLILD